MHPRIQKKLMIISKAMNNKLKEVNSFRVLKHRMITEEMLLILKKMAMLNKMRGKSFFNQILEMKKVKKFWKQILLLLPLIIMVKMEKMAQKKKIHHMKDHLMVLMHLMMIKLKLPLI